jgi:glyoxylase-like metal-dependent hydrolase (beta-lactamase superfamily II)
VGTADDLFRVEPVADGVHVAIAAHAYKVNCNTAIVETDDGVLIVDSHSKPSAARAVVARVRELTAKPVRYVVNTHFHWDHWQGNETYPAAFGHVEIITTDITREAMLRQGLKRVQDHVRTGPGEIGQLRAALAAAAEPARQAALRSDLAQAEEYLAEIRALRPALPTMAFERAMRMIRGDREIQLLHLGRAHTEGDVFVYLPREKVVITGDAVIGWTPFMGDGYPQDWVGTLDRLADLDFEYMIMGHGGTAGKDWLKLFRSYIGDLVAAVRREAEAGATLAETQARVIEILAPVYEGPLTAYAGDYRPWRTLALGNVERTYAMVS